MQTSRSLAVCASKTGFLTLGCETTQMISSRLYREQRKTSPTWQSFLQAWISIVLMLWTKWMMQLKKPSQKQTSKKVSLGKNPSALPRWPSWCCKTATWMSTKMKTWSFLRLLNLTLEAVSSRFKAQTTRKSRPSVRQKSWKSKKSWLKWNLNS